MASCFSVKHDGKHAFNEQSESGIRVPDSDFSASSLADDLSSFWLGADNWTRSVPPTMRIFVMGRSVGVNELANFVVAAVRRCFGFEGSVDFGCGRGLCDGRDSSLPHPLFALA